MDTPHCEICWEELGWRICWECHGKVGDDEIADEDKCPICKGEGGWWTCPLFHGSSRFIYIEVTP